MQIVIITLGKATTQIQFVLHGINMAFTNLTESPKKTLFKDLACSTEFNTEVHNQLVVLLALNGFVAITAFFGNTLILVALGCLVGPWYTDLQQIDFFY